MREQSPSPGHPRPGVGRIASCAVGDLSRTYHYRLVKWVSLNGWGIYGLKGRGIHGWNGWGIHGLNGWGSYGKVYVSYCFFWAKNTGLQWSTVSGHCMTTVFGPFNLNSLTLSHTWLHFVHERAVPIWPKCVLCSGWPSFFFFLCQVMLGGHWFSELFGDPDTADPSTITRTALDTLRDHLGIRQTPSLTVTRVHKVYTHLCGYIGFLYHITSLSKYFIRWTAECIYNNSLHKTCMLYPNGLHKIE